MKICNSLDLPADVVSRTNAILAQKGAGKTYTGKKLSEEILKAGAQLVALDPTGVWWGLKAEGTGPGFPILVMGGVHGDLPLAPDSGEIVADFVVESGQSVILDLSSFESNGEQNRFVTDFAERLYRAKHNRRSPLHLMLDEADSFAPQRPALGEQRMLGAFEAIVRRGRSRGLGMTMITQRPAVLNKNVLSQVDLLIALRVIGPQDHKALGDWTALNGTKEQRTAFLDALPSLPNGEAFFWSPSWLGCFVRDRVLPLRTFDSSQTPEPGVILKAPKLAEVDLQSLSKRILAAGEEAKANDPKLLRAEIARLQTELAGKVQDASALDRKYQEGFDDCRHRTEGVLIVARSALQKVSSDAIATMELLNDILRTDGKASQKTIHEISPRTSESRPARQQGPEAGTVAALVADLSKAETRIVTALASSGAMTKRKLGLLTGYSSKSGSFRNALSKLRTAGFINNGEPVELTEAGQSITVNVPPLPTGKALHEYWLNQLGKAERSILEVLLISYPRAMTKDSIGAHTDYSPVSGSFRNALSKLRTMELIEGSSEIKASADLF